MDYGGPQGRYILHDSSRRSYDAEATDYLLIYRLIYRLDYRIRKYAESRHSIRKTIEPVNGGDDEARAIYNAVRIQLSCSAYPVYGVRFTPFPALVIYKAHYIHTFFGAKEVSSVTSIPPVHGVCLSLS